MLAVYTPPDFCVTVNGTPHQMLTAELWWGAAPHEAEQARSTQPGLGAMLG